MVLHANGCRALAARAVFALSAGVLAVLGAVPPAVASCPAPEEIRVRLGELDLARSARTIRFSTALPRKQLNQAAGQVGKLYTDRDGKKGFGVVVVEMPVEALWAAVNDEDAHDLEGYLPLKRSEVIGGTPRGTSRRVFQAGEAMGLGRWWVTRTAMSGDLFASSGGALWEVVWEDDMENVDPKQPPVDDPPDLSPIKWSRGAWLLVPLGESCTFLEHFTWSDPGGFVGMVQGLVLGKALSQSIEGVLRLADERYRTLPDGRPFVRPDGTPLMRPDPEPAAQD